RRRAAGEGGLRQELAISVHGSERVRFALLPVANLSAGAGRVSVFGYHEWTLCPPRAGERMHVRTEFDRETQAVLAVNPYNQDFRDRVAFVHAGPVRSATGDRTEVVGRNGTFARPAALGRVGLSNRFGAGLDPCAALQVELSLEPGETRQVVFLLGQGRDREGALRLVRAHGSVEAALTALQETEGMWDG